ncbi:hypothetical protein MLD38_034948 [Melastoma candidum]|uniref:Uncharacterized protein n=1 Tax=Melastoma candidum TaxID=119954 RepID=A0ACB9MB68_9MYRT|nr:hypothetical protein MLD38_034948 [Melastoma candidum]
MASEAFLTVSPNNFPTAGSPSASPSGVSALPKRGLLEKSRNYKFWVLAALILLAFWSMLISSVTLRRSSGAISDRDSPDAAASFEDLDILEIEKRENVVRHMWDVYIHSKTTRLPRFWQDAFHAAYESLVSDTPGVRDAAFTEIAKMSLRSTVSDPFAVQQDANNDSPAVNGKLF